MVVITSQPAGHFDGLLIKRENSFPRMHPWLFSGLLASSHGVQLVPWAISVSAMMALGLLEEHAS